MFIEEFKISQNSNEQLDQEYKIYKINFVENLKNIFLQLKQLKSITFIIKSLSLICYNSFIDMHEVKLSIEFLLLSFFEDNKYDSKKENYLDKLLQYILTNGLNDGFCKILELPDFIFLIYPNLDYLKKLVNFYLKIKVLLYFNKIFNFRSQLVKIWIFFILTILMMLINYMQVNFLNIVLLNENVLGLCGFLP